MGPNMNIHTPERGADESQSAYKLRRSLSRAAVRSMTCRGLGDQHKAPTSRQQLRDSQRANGNGPKGTYGRGLMNHYARRMSAAAVRSMTCRGLGDQHKAPTSRQQLRDSQRANGNGPKGTYGRGLMNHYARRMSAAAAAKAQRRALA